MKLSGWLLKLPVAVLALTLFAAAAEARYYHASLGGWIARDPEGNVGGPSLYEYGGSNPATRTDPSGKIIIGMGGFMFMGHGEVEGMCTAIATQINARKPGLRGGEGEFCQMRIGCIGWDLPQIIKDLENFKKRKDGHLCWHEQVVLVGYSDGATSIWRLFNTMGGKVLGALESETWGGHYHVAHVSLIDMIHLGDYKLLSDPNKVTQFNDLGVLIGGTNFYQQDPHGWKGYRIEGGNFENFLMYGVSHGSIVRGWFLQQYLTSRAVEAYLRREPPDQSPSDPRQPPVD
jgi:hypothetical protein